MWRWFSRNKKLSPQGFIAQEDNCVYTKQGLSEEVLILSRFTEPTNDAVVNFCKERATTVIASAAYLRNELDITDQFTPLENHLFNYISQTTLFEISQGKYDFWLHSSLPIQEELQKYVRLIYGWTGDDVDTYLRLSRDSNIFQNYMEEIKPLWQIQIPIIEDKLVPLQEMRKCFEGGATTSGIIAEGSADSSEVKKVITAVYRAGLPEHWPKIPDRSGLALEAIAYHLMLNLQYQIVPDDEVDLWNTGIDLEVRKGLNEKPN